MGFLRVGGLPRENPTSTLQSFPKRSLRNPTIFPGPPPPVYRMGNHPSCKNKFWWAKSLHTIIINIIIKNNPFFKQKIPRVEQVILQSTWRLWHHLTYSLLSGWKPSTLPTSEWKLMEDRWCWRWLRRGLCSFLTMVVFIDLQFPTKATKASFWASIR